MGTRPAIDPPHARRFWHPSRALNTDRSAAKTDQAGASVLRESLVVIGILLVLAATAVNLQVRSRARFQPTAGFVEIPAPPRPGTPPGDCGSATRDGKPRVVEMLYSEEKRAWIEEAADQFAHRCPDIQIKLTAMGDLVSADAILSGKARPTLWSPSDHMVLAYLSHRWRSRTQDPLFAGEPVSLVRSPLVLLMLEERLRVYREIHKRSTSDTGMWSQLLCAFIPAQPPVESVALEDRIPGQWIDWYDSVVLAPKREATRAVKSAAKARAAKPKAAKMAPADAAPAAGEVVYKAPFPSVEAIRGWENVHVGHSSPTHTAAGLETLYLMAYDHLLPPEARPPRASFTTDGFHEGPVHRREDLADAFLQALVADEEPLRRWFARCEGGLEADPPSAQLLTDTMFHLGDQLYDGVATYEHLVFPILERLAGNVDSMAKLTVVYPPTTFVNAHPAILLAGVDERTADAAHAWLGFLRGGAMQHRAIDLGFRPADPAIKIRDYDADTNPFLRFRRFGVQFLEPIAEPPRLGGERVHQLLEIWRDATGRN